MSIHKRQTARGVRYDVRLRTLGGKVYNRTFDTKDKAKAYERAELTARDRGDWIDPTARLKTLGEVATDWLASNPAKRESSLTNDRTLLAKHVLPELGAKRLGTITPGEVQDLLNGLPLAPRSVRRVHSTMRAICNYAMANDVIARTPMRGIKLPAVDKPRVHVFTPEELVAVAEAMPAEYRPMVWLGAVLGLRWGEVAGLAVGSVDVLGRTLRVEQAITKGTAGEPVLGPPKSEAGRRTLALPQALADVLGAHMLAVGLTAADPDALLFTAPEGGLLRTSAWRRRVWLPAIAAAGLGGMVKDKEDGREGYVGPGFHDLRRTSATELVVGGVDVKTAQYRLGHSSPVLTLEVYAQAVSSAERDAAEALGSRLMTG